MPAPHLSTSRLYFLQLLLTSRATTSLISLIRDDKRSLMNLCPLRDGGSEYCRCSIMYHCQLYGLSLCYRDIAQESLNHYHREGLMIQN